MPSVIPCSLSHLISRIHSFLFSDWRRTISSKFFDRQFLSISTWELVIFRQAFCVLSHLCCNGHSLLLSSQSALSSCGLFVQLLSGDSLSLYDDRPCGGEFPGIWGFIVFRHALIPWKGSGNNNNANKTTKYYTFNTLLLITANNYQ